MDFEAYRSWLRQGRGEALTDKYIASTREYEQFLKDSRSRTLIEEASPGDFSAFEAAFDAAEGRRSFPYWYLHILYRYLENREMADAVMDACARRPIAAELKMLRTTPLALRRGLERLGIRTNLELLDAASTPARREALAKQVDAQLEDLETLVRMADLRRIVGVSRVVSLMEAGIDSLDAIASSTADELHQRVAAAHPGKRVNRTDYEYLPYKARFYPRWIEWPPS